MWLSRRRPYIDLQGVDTVAKRGQLVLDLPRRLQVIEALFYIGHPRLQVTGRLHTDTQTIEISL